MDNPHLIVCLVNGKRQTLTPAAYKIAKSRFHAVLESELLINKPVELMKPRMAAPTIIKPAFKEPDVILMPQVEPLVEEPKVVKRTPAKRKKIIR